MSGTTTATTPARRVSRTPTPPRPLVAMRSWFDSARQLPGAVAPCATPRSAVCTTGIVFVAVHGGAPDLPPASARQLPALELLAHMPLPYAVPISSERFASWMERQGDRVGRIDGRLFDLGELRRAFAAMPASQTVAIGMGVLGNPPRELRALFLDGAGWRIGIAEIAYPADGAPLEVPAWITARDGADA